MSSFHEAVTRGTAAARPASGSVVGHLYFATDTGVITRWSGSAWESYSGGSGDSTLTSAYASRPAASNDGNLFLPSDSQQIERDTGAAYVPWGPINPLTAPSDTGFAWVNQGSATITTSRGNLEIFSPSEGAGDNIRARVKTAPAAPYTITACLRMNLMSRSFQRAGLCWRQSSDGKIITWGLVGITSGAALLELAKFTNATTFSAVYGTSTVWAAGAPLFWRLEDNNTNRIASVSADGINFIAFHTVGRTDFMTADQVGFFVESTNNASPNFDVSMSVLSWKQA